MNASAGWRSVSQKKMARIPRASAIVVLIASVCRLVSSSVTVPDVMLSDVAVIASSSPPQSASMSSWIRFVPAGSSV